MDRNDDFARLRESVESAAADAQSRFRPEAGGQNRRACKTCQPDGTTYPTAPNVWYWLQEYEITGTATVGSPGVETPRGDPFAALHVGGVAPPKGTPVTATAVPFRWVFPY